MVIEKLNAAIKKMRSGRKRKEPLLWQTVIGAVAKEYTGGGDGDANEGQGDGA